MRIIALLGSPHKNGNFEILADEIFVGVKSKSTSIEKYHLDDYYIRPISEVIDNSRVREDRRINDDFLKLFNPFLESGIVI